MDYYGYFQTFNFLVVESQLIATLIGFESIFFIFWFNHKYNPATKNKAKELTEDDKLKLSIATTIFIGIMLFGMIILIGNLGTLYREPIFLENLFVQTENLIEIPTHIVEHLDFSHTLFTLWTFFSFIYIVALILSLDIFEFEIKEETKKKQKGRKIRFVKKNTRKNRKLSGGK